MLGFFVVQIITGLAVLFAWLFGVEVSWRLLLVIGLTGFMASVWTRLEERADALEQEGSAHDA